MADRMCRFRLTVQFGSQVVFMDPFILLAGFGGWHLNQRSPEVFRLTYAMPVLRWR
jgi:hypothetical protein